MSEDAALTAERTLMRHQQHTLRERLHLVERRLHDLEMAQHNGAVRTDVHADAIADIRATVALILKDMDQMEREKLTP